MFLNLLKLFFHKQYIIWDNTRVAAGGNLNKQKPIDKNDFDSAFDEADELLSNEYVAGFQAARKSQSWKKFSRDQFEILTALIPGELRMNATGTMFYNGMPVEYMHRSNNLYTVKFTNARGLPVRCDVNGYDNSVWSILSRVANMLRFDSQLKINQNDLSDKKVSARELC